MGSGTENSREVQLAAVKRAEEGESLAELGAEHGVSRERVRQWVEKHSTMSNDEIRARRSERRAADTRDRAVKLLRMMKESGQIKATSDVPQYLRPWIVDAFGEDEAQEMRLMSFSLREFSKISREEILEDIRRIAALREGPISGPFFNEHSQTVSHVRVLQIFDKWSNACEEAGVEYVPAIRDNYVRKFSREDCIVAVRQFLKHHPHGSFALYCEWAQKNGKPSGGTLRNRLDRKWMEVRRIAMSDEGHE